MVYSFGSRARDFKSGSNRDSEENLWRPRTAFLKQIIPQAIYDKTPISFGFDQTRVFEDLQVVRHRHQFRFQEFGDVTDRHFTVARRMSTILNRRGSLSAFSWSAHSFD